MTTNGGRGAAHALLDGLLAEYDRYKKAVSYIPTDQLKLQEDLRRYLCLRCAGFLEQVTFVVLNNHLDQKSSGPIRAFNASFFQHAPNLRVDPYLKLVGRFGGSYRESFETLLEPTRRDLLTDLLEVRNDIAHGKASNGRKLDPSRYITLCEEIYDWLIETFIGNTAEVLAEDGRTILGYVSTT